MASREIQSSSNVAAAGPSSQDTLEIPPFIEPPKVEHLPNVKTLTHVVFDIETTNKYLFDNEIIQVSAACGEDHFDLKIDSPTKDQNVEQQQVNAVTSDKEALQKFVSWLQRFDDPVVLLSHNGKIFDIPRLILRLQDYGLLDDFKEKVVGSLDTMILFKNYFSMGKNPSLRSLTEKHIPDYKYEAHDSLQDTLALKKLLETKANISEDQLAFTDASFTLRYAIRYVDYARNRYANWQTLRSLPISKDMQKKIAGSGLQYCHLKEAYEMKGRDGIERVLSQEIHGKPRITKQQRIIMKICDHFQHRYMDCKDKA